MPDTVTNLMNSGGKLGFGSPLRLQFSGGVHNGDVITATAQWVVSGSPVDLLSSTLTSQADFTGSILTPQWFLGSGWFLPTTIATFRYLLPSEEVVPPNTSVQLRCEWRTSGGGLRASNTTISFVWDGPCDVGNLIRLLPSVSAPDLADIRAAVIRTFPPS